MTKIKGITAIIRHRARPAALWFAAPLIIVAVFVTTRGSAFDADNWPHTNDWYLQTRGGVVISDDEARNSCMDPTNNANPSQATDIGSRADCNVSGGSPEYNPGSEIPGVDTKEIYSQGYFFKDFGDPSNGCTGIDGTDPDYVYFQTRLSDNPLGATEAAGLQANLYWWMLDADNPPDGIADFYIELNGHLDKTSEYLRVRYETNGDNDPTGEPETYSTLNPLDNDGARVFALPNNNTLTGNDDNWTEYFIEVRIPVTSLKDNALSPNQVLCEGDQLRVITHTTGEQDNVPFHKDLTCPFEFLDPTDPLFDPVKCVSDPIVLSEPEFELTKTVVDLNGGSAAAGDILEYTVVAKNISGPLTDFDFTDALNGGPLDGSSASTATVTFQPDSYGTDSGIKVSLGSTSYNMSNDDDTPDNGPDVTDCSAATDCRAAYDSGTDTITVHNDIIYANDSQLSDPSLYDSITIMWRVEADGAGIYKNQAQAVVDETDGPQVSDFTGTDSFECTDDTFINCDDNDDDNDDPTPIVILPAADLSITKVAGVDSANVGDLIVYSLVVKNNGPDDATSIVVTDVIPAELSYISNTCGASYDGGSTTLTWNIASLADQASDSCDVSVTVNQAATCDDISNTATVVSTDQTTADPEASNNSASDTVHVLNADLDVTKIVDNATPNTGDTVKFTITVNNSGPDSANNVVVTDLLPAGLSYDSDTASQGSYVSGTGIWAVGTLASGVDETLEINAIVTATAGTSVSNTAVAVAKEKDCDPDDNDDEISLTVQSADVFIVKDVNDATPNVTDTITYTLTVGNNGPDTATNVVVTDTLQAGVTYISNDCGANDAGAPTIVWTIASLAMNAGAVCNIQASIDTGTGGTLIDNIATVDADQDDPDDGNNTDNASITPQQANLSIVKTVDNNTPNAGTNVTYTLEVTNNGPTNATGVVVTDVLPAGITYVSNTCGASYDGGSTTLTWNIGALNSGASISCDFVATVSLGTGSDTIHNVATITASDQFDDNPADDTDFEDIEPVEIDIELIKQVNNPTANEGEQIIWTIVATNHGPDDATGLIVSDVLPAGVSFVSADSQPFGTYNDATGDWNIGTLPTNASVFLMITVTVQPGTAGQPDIVNVCSIQNVNEPDSNPSNNDVSCISGVHVGTLDLGVTKIVDDAEPAEGDTVVFTVTITNNGSDDATGVQLTDLLPAGLTHVGNTPSQGSYDSGTGIWTVGNLAVSVTATITISASVNDGTANTTLTNTATMTDVDQTDSNPDNNSAQAAVTVDEEFTNCTDVDPASLTVDCSEKLFPDPLQAKGVCVTRDDLFFDMFTATPLCKKLGYSMLATKTEAPLLQNVADEIVRLAAGRTAPQFEIRVFGQQEAVSVGVLNALQALGIDPVVERTGGLDREFTATLSSIALMALEPTTSDLCIADNILGIDTISMAPVAANGSPVFTKYCPQMLTDRTGNGTSGELHQTVKDFLTLHGKNFGGTIDTAIISGGLAAVPQAARDDLKRLGLTLIEFSGTDRFETSELINNQYFPAPTTVVGVDGRITNIPHPTNPRMERHGKPHYAALIGGHIAATLGNAALVLFDDGLMPSFTKNYLQAKAGSISTGWTVGDIDPAVLTEFLNLI